MDLLTDELLLAEKKQSKASSSFKPNPTRAKSQSRANAAPRTTDGVAHKAAEEAVVPEKAVMAPALPLQNAMPADPKPVSVHQHEQEVDPSASVPEILPRAKVRFAAVSSHAVDKEPPSNNVREVQKVAKKNDIEAAASSLLQFKSQRKTKEAEAPKPPSALIESSSSEGIAGWKKLLTGMRENLHSSKNTTGEAKRSRKSKGTADESAAAEGAATASRRRRRPKRKSAVEEEEEEEEHEHVDFEVVPAKKRRRKAKGELTIQNHFSAAGLAFSRMPTVKEDQEVDPENWSIRHIIAKGQSWDKKKMTEAKKAKKDTQGEGEGGAEAGPSSSSAAAAAAGALAPSTSALVVAPPPAASSMGPRLQVINGQIVVDTASLTIQAQRPDDASNYTRVEEDNRLINSHSYMKKQTGERWRPEETKLFYRALRHFGTDFTLIAQLFPKRDRKHIKNKYNKEIKTMPSMVNEALIGGKNPEETKELFEVILSNQRAAAAAGAIEN